MRGKGILIHMGTKQLALAVLVPLLAACASGKAGRPNGPEDSLRAPREEWQGVVRIAVLPPANETMDVSLEHRTWYRAVVMTHLKRHGWVCVPIADVNRPLVRWKFTVSGEVAQFTADELAEAFGCDAILSWAILEASGNSVVLDFVLHKRDDTVLWASGERTFRPDYKILESTELRPVDRSISMAVHEVLLDFPVRR